MYDNDINKRIDKLKQQIHDENLEKLSAESNISVMNVALATQQLAMEQHQANELQFETIKVLKEQQQELKKRNEILEDEIKSTNKHNKVMMIITIISTCVAIASLVATIFISLSQK